MYYLPIEIFHVRTMKSTLTFENYWRRIKLNFCFIRFRQWWFRSFQVKPCVMSFTLLFGLCPHLSRNVFPRKWNHLDFLNCVLITSGSEAQWKSMTQETKCFECSVVNCMGDLFPEFPKFTGNQVNSIIVSKLYVIKLISVKENK